MTVRVETFGGLRIFRDGLELEALPGKPVQCALLVYLALERSATRDTILDLLWPDKNTQKGRRSLNNTVYELRSVLGADWVTVSGDSLRVASWIHTDVAELEAAARERPPEEALEAVGRPFLEGCHLVATGPFEDWISRRRAEIDHLARGIRERAVQALYARGELQSALLAAQAWAESAPLGEKAHYWLIRLLAESGQRGAAISHYERLRQIFLSELSTEPDDELEHLVERIKSREVSGDLEPRLEPTKPNAPPGPVSTLVAKKVDRRQRRPRWRLVGGYVMVAGGLLQGIDVLVGNYPDLPDTFFDAALVLLACGLPMVVATALFEGQAVDGGVLKGPRLWAARWFSWRNAALAAAAGLAAWSAAFIGWVVVGPGLGLTSLDPRTVVVFPLVGPAGSGGQAAQGWDAALAIGGALEHTDPLRFVDGWRELTPEQKREPTLVTPGVARSVAERLGAGRYIEGVIWSEGESSALTLRLYDARGDSLLTRQSVRGSSRSTTVPELALEAVVSILPSLVGEESRIDITALTDRSVASTALWLQGERAYRESRFVEALEFLERAVSIDDTHAFAALRGAQAADWASDTERAQALIESALTHERLLPPKYRRLADGLQAQYAGRARDAHAAFTEALRIDLEWSEAAMSMGENYYHLLPDDGVRPDSIAETWFERAWAADPSFSPPLFHLAQIRLRAHDPDSTARIVEVWKAFEPDSVQFRQVELALDCVREEGRFDWSSLTPIETRPVLLAALHMGPSGTNARCAEGAFTAVFEGESNPEIRWTAARGLVGLAMASGDSAKAGRLLATALENGISATHTLYVYASLAGGPFATQADTAEQVLRRAFGDVYEGADPGWRWLMGSWLFERGEVGRLRRLVDAMERSARETDDRTTRLLSVALSARLALAEVDTLTAIARLATLTPNAPIRALQYVEPEALAPERLLLAELYLATGRALEAYSTASLLDHAVPGIYPLFLRRSLEIRLEAARALQEAELAQDVQARLDGLGPD